MPAIVPNIGTIVEIASGTRRKVVLHPPIANVVAQIKNMDALQIIKKYTLLYKSVPQNTARSCSSLLNPFVIKPKIVTNNPKAIKPNDHVRILPGISNLSFIAAIISLL